MASPDLLYTDVIAAESGSVVASSANTNFPAANVVTTNYSNVWRSTAAGASAETLTVDLGSAQTVDAVGLGNVNFQSTATVTVAGNATDSWGGPTFGPETIVATGLDGVRRNLYHPLSSSQSFRYWRISITDNGNPDGFLEVGRWFQGVKVTVTDSFDANITLNHRFGSVELRTEYDQAFVFSRDRNLDLNISWTNVRAATRTELLALFRTVKANGSPFFFVFDTTSPAEAFYVRMAQQGFNEVKIDFNVYRLSMILIEETPGLIVPKV